MQVSFAYRTAIIIRNLQRPLRQAIVCNVQYKENIKIYEQKWWNSASDMNCKTA